MTISIQGSNAALTALETLSSSLSGAGGTNALLQAGAPGDPSSQSAASILDLSSGAGALNGPSQGLTAAASATDAGISAGATVADLLSQMQQEASSAADTSLSSADRASLDAAFKANLVSIRKAVAGAGVGGLNLVDGSAGSGSSFAGVDLSLGGPLIGVSSDASLGSPDQAADIATQLGQSIPMVDKALAELSAQSQAIQSHLGLMAQAGSLLSPGVSGGVDDSLDGDGAALAALQVSQQLAGAGGSIASGAPQAILSLFR
ncbi:MAG: hypothetical protein ACREEW_13145 [Caulobacteraceae bacterium]